MRKLSYSARTAQFKFNFLIYATNRLRDVEI